MTKVFEYLFSFLRCIRNWIRRGGRFPIGTDLFDDIQYAFGKKGVITVFDVGANVGHFVDSSLRHFPNASIQAFEPVSDNFSVLDRKHEGNPLVSINRFALGDCPQELEIAVNKDLSECSFVNSYGDFHKEKVSVETLDRHCESEKIDRIDLLKIDVEGYELEVLRGAASMLRENAIGVIFVETEIIESEFLFVPLAKLADYLGQFGYKLFGIYNQQQHWDGKKSLYFVNALFVSEALDAGGRWPSENAGNRLAGD